MPDTPDPMKQLMEGMSRQIFSELQKRIEPVVEGAWAGIQKEIEIQADSLIKENTHRKIDAPSGLFLHTCSLLLAAYRVILPLIKDREKVLDIMDGAMGARLRGGIETYLVDRFGIEQDAPEEAFDKARQNFKKIGEVRFGRAYIYEQEDQSDSSSSVHVRKCFFHEFFSENGAPEITPVFCKQDNVWMDEMNKPKYGLKVTRSTIIAEGDDACSFHFTKTD